MPLPTVVHVAPHPVLEASAFVTEFPRSLGEIAPGPELALLLRPGASAPFASDDDVRKHVRDLLRHGGYKPTGRGKPASEYLLSAVAEGAVPTINAAVDACNAVSYHSGLPISVVDLERAVPPLGIRFGAAGETYVFNASGQALDPTGLLCLCDALGPCANAVKDAQRTKTHSGTRHTLSVLWGTRALPGRSAAVAEWYRELLAGAGARTFAVDIVREG